MTQEKEGRRRRRAMAGISMSLRSQLGYLSAVVVLLSGLLGLFNPDLVLGLVGLAVTEPRGYGEARALFGALFVTMGGFMLWAVAIRPRARGILRFVGFLWLASALARLLSLVIEGPFSLGAILLLGLDLLVGVGALASATEPEPRKPAGSSADEADPLNGYRT